jgi:TolB-like protein/class 3 adenylate cyclase
MAETRVERRLAAILAADVAGYSRMMGVDEEGTLAALKALRKSLIDPKIAEHHGRIVKTTGDGALIEFASAVDAVRCALDIQCAMPERNRDVPEDRRIEFRIGINVGDVIIDEGDIYGDGVNIAARLEAIADVGSICISEDAYRQIKGKLSLDVSDISEQKLKNIAQPVRVYRVAPGKGRAAPLTALPLTLPDKPSIAVLPFQNMSDDPQQEYFADGISEDIITGLSKLRWFFVIARNSTFAYKDKATDVKRIGRELGVRYVLEGSVRKGGNRVRITAQLIDASTGNHIWAERYDRELTDVFELQDEITASVTAALEPKLLAAEGIRSETRSIEDLDAWDLVARALSHFWKLTAPESKTAIVILRQAVERHPGYAPAHSMLAFALLVSAHVGWIDSGEDRELAARLAHRAMDLDDSDPWAHMALGYLAIRGHQTDEAVRHFRAALDLNPNFAAAYGYVGWALVFNGQSEEALRYFDQSIRLSPRDPLHGFFFAGISAAHYLAGRFTEAIKFGRQAVQLRPGILGGHRILCASLAQAGQIEEARAAMSTLRQLHPTMTIAWIKESVPYTTEPMARFLEGLRKAGLE